MNCPVSVRSNTWVRDCVAQLTFIYLSFQRKRKKKCGKAINQALERRQCWLYADRCLVQHCYQELEHSAWEDSLTSQLAVAQHLCCVTSVEVQVMGRLDVKSPIGKSKAVSDLCTRSCLYLWKTFNFISVHLWRIILQFCEAHKKWNLFVVVGASIYYVVDILKCFEADFGV